MIECTPCLQEPFEDPFTTPQPSSGLILAIEGLKVNWALGETFFCEESRERGEDDSQ